MYNGSIIRRRPWPVAIALAGVVASLICFVLDARLEAVVAAAVVAVLVGAMATVAFCDLKAVNRLLLAGSHPTGWGRLREMGLALSQEIPNTSFCVGYRPAATAKLRWFALHGPVLSVEELGVAVPGDEQDCLIVRDHYMRPRTSAGDIRFSFKHLVCMPFRLSDYRGSIRLLARSERTHFDTQRVETLLRAVAPKLGGAVLQHLAELESETAIGRFEFLLERTNELVWTLNAQTQWSYANGAVLHTYGLPKEELLKRCFTDFTSSSDAKRDRKMIRNVLDGAKVRDYETRHRRTDGKEVILRIHAAPLKAVDGSIVGVVGSAGNITEWVRERIEGEYNSGMFAGILSRMPVIFFRLDGEKRFTDVRGRGLARLGADDGDWNGRDARWLFRNADARIDAALNGGSDVFETGGVDEAGPWWFLNHLTFDNWHGNGAIGFGIDITEARLAKEQSDRLAFENKGLAHRLLEVQESERRHLARELHDDMGQSLTAIKTVSVALANMRNPDGAEVRKLGSAITEIAGKLYEVVHKRMRELRPGLLDSLGLVEALKECIHSSRIEQTGVDCRFSVQGRLDDLGELLEITIFRVVQECLTNIAKHAMASAVTVSLSRSAVERARGTEDRCSKLILEVADDGVGLNGVPHQGMGLQGMQERVRALGGQLSVVSEPGEGVTVRVELEVPDVERCDEIRRESVG